MSRPVRTDPVTDPVRPRAAPSVQLAVGPWRSGPDRELRQVGDRSARWSLLEPGELRFSTVDATFRAPDFGAGINDVQLWRNGSLLGRWRIVNQSSQFDANRVTTNVTARDYFHLMDSRPVGVHSWVTPTEQASIAWTIVDTSEMWGVLGFTQASDWTATGVTRTDIETTPEDSCYQMLRKLAEMPDGFEPVINPDLSISLNHPRAGSDNGVTLTFHAEPNGQVPTGSIVDLGRTADMGNYANMIRQSGADGLTPIVVFLAGTASAPEGAWVRAVGDPSIATGELLTGAAAASLARYSEVFPEYSFTLAPGFWQGPDHIWLGDLVRYIIKAGQFDIDQQARVTELSISWDSGGNETVTLAVSKNSVAGSRAIRRALRTIRDLRLR